MFTEDYQNRHSNKTSLIRSNYSNSSYKYIIMICCNFLISIICLSTYFVTPVFSQEYVFETTWGSPGISFGSFSQPQGIAVDSQGNLYVTDFTALANQVQKFTGDGTFITAWGFLGFGAGFFTNPAGIAADQSNNIYVADFGSPEIAVQKFTSDGEFINGWGSLGLGQGQFINPAVVAVDSEGNVYVTDLGENNDVK